MAKERGAESLERPAERVEEGEANCKECVHYPLRRKGINTSMAAVMKEATNNFESTFCGTQPKIKKGKLQGQPMMDGISCVGKKFERA
jgi:hypothetical protein